MFAFRVYILENFTQTALVGKADLYQSYINYFLILNLKLFKCYNF